MTEAEVRLLGEAIRAGIEQHRSHRPGLFQGVDGIWRCPQCELPSLRERASVFLLRQRNRVTRWRR